MCQMLGLPEAAMFAARRAASRRVSGVLALRRSVRIAMAGSPYATYSACIESYALMAGGTDLRAALLAAAGTQIQADLLALSDGLRRAGHAGGRPGAGSGAGWLVECPAAVTSVGGDVGGAVVVAEVLVPVP